MRTVTVKNLVIGQGMPKICIPITGKNRAEIEQDLEIIRSMKPDLAEWRVDCYEAGKNGETIWEMLRTISDKLGEIPLLFTFRTRQEGGEKEILYEDYVKLLEKAARTGLADLMDVEVFFQPEETKALIKSPSGNPAFFVVASNHHFQRTPDAGELQERMRYMDECGAVALDCYGRDKNGINGLLRNIDTALIATLEIGLKRTSVIALLLYRPVLKKAITIEEVEQKFGADVTLIIRRLLKTSDLYARNTAVNSENFHHLLFSFAEDVRVILLMIADRLCLMRMGKTDARG